ncbi:MAG: hypothetical protein SPJ13_06080 [Bacteroidales bacterium]|nr:hypothetical protein [Bacteroidales bacterium]
MRQRTLSLIRLSFFVALGAVCMVACDPKGTDYSPSQLIGKWVRVENGVQGTEYYRFDNGDPVLTGATWDTADDVNEDEAQPFEWTLEGNQLTIVHIMEMGGRIPKAYTVTGLTASSLLFKDNYGQKFEYKRVN